MNECDKNQLIWIGEENEMKISKNNKIHGIVGWKRIFLGQNSSKIGFGWDLNPSMHGQNFGDLCIKSLYFTRGCF
jgi:hypothetical protein